MSGSVRNRDVRLDIQVLRAFAVGVVVCAHLWPHGKLAGGFVGVDIFFVISGFLITSHLVEHVPTNVRDLVDFWGRRVRRLLPASLTVLAATTVAAWVWLPEALWSTTARQVRSAATYWINWHLAGDSVDYFAANNQATPVQHYWSLAVEEQFYVVWPLLLLALTYLGWRLRDRRWLYFVGLLVVVAVSLWWSITYTRSTPAAAYFVSTTRVWELGSGGLLAVAYPVVARLLATTWGERARTPIAYAGWLLMGAAVLRFSETTAIPGWRAAVPVAGVLLVIAANASLDWYPVGALQWLGDHSYSVYLWHWPLLLIVPAATQSSRGWKEDLAIIVGTLVLAVLTKRYIEDPVRTLAWWRRRVPTYAFGAAGMAVVFGLAGTWSVVENRRQDAYQAQLAAKLAGADKCFGAPALAPGANCGRSLTGEFVPRSSTWQVGALSEDKPGLHGQACTATEHEWPVTRCDAGDPSSPVKVVLTGNSHALQWLEALSNIAETERWHLITYYATGCPFASWPRTSFMPKFAPCADWEEKVISTVVQLKPTLVVTSNLGYRFQYNGWFKPENTTSTVDAYLGAYRRLNEAGIRTLVIKDAPAATGGDKSDTAKFPNADPIRCLEANPDNYEPCSAPRSEWEYEDPAVEAAKKLTSPTITSVDLNNHICGPDVCDAVVGGIRVRQDHSHLTATYVHTLIPYLRPALVEAVRTSKPRPS
ncbi:acyltransferase family protein [Actinoplanes sp. NPDC051859]|uniref:acyltransferase family protein n=1 Tax=Actinoplanes sp. NPDC051859 TaxID=3363909 RepID=UPI00378971F6